MKTVIPTPKFNLGDKVYWINTSKLYKNVPCETCDGKEVVIIKDKEYDCPHCNGRGCFTERDTDKYVVSNSSGRITKIRFDISQSMIYPIVYEINNSYGGSHRVESEVFTTKKEAQLMCNKLNKGEK